MISKKLMDAINEQMIREFYSEYLYLGMAAWCSEQYLNGFANWMQVQAKEEHAHGFGFYTYLINRGGKVKIKEIPKPPIEFKDITAMFKTGLEHEKLVTKYIDGLMDIAKADKDHAGSSFLNWYVDEQVEEESNFETILGKLAKTNGKAEGLLFLDAELATRTYVPVNINGIIIP